MKNFSSSIIHEKFRDVNGEVCVLFCEKLQDGFLNFIVVFDGDGEFNLKRVDTNI